MDRRVLGWMAVIAGLVAITGCATGLAAPTTPSDDPPGTEADAADTSKIPISPASHVCVAVFAQQRIWPGPQSEEVHRALSGNLMVGLRRIFTQRDSKADNMPGRNSGQRFRGGPSGRDPDCRDAGTDVFVTVQYGPRENGKPYLMQYWVSRGTSVRYGAIDVNVAEEIAAGRIRGYSRDRNDGTIIGDDTLRRAELIANLLVMSSR